MGNIQYAIRVSKRARRLQIKINRLAQVEVVSPLRVTKLEIAAFVNSHLAWIARHQKKIRSQYNQNESQLQALPTDIYLPFLDKTYDVIYSSHSLSGKKNHFSIKENIIHVYSDDDNEKRLILQTFIHRLAKDELTQLLNKISSNLALPYHRVFIKAQKTRWGSCSSKKNINLNRNLLFLTPTQVEYLIIHELCHTVHLNHSSRYWALVSSFLPSYKTVDQSLKNATSCVPFWALR